MTESTFIPLLQADQRERWRRGDRAAVESYLAERPALQSDPDGLLDLIYQEMLLREESGDTPCLPEYLARFPLFEAELRRLFEVHQVVESEPLDDTPPPTKMMPLVGAPTEPGPGPGAPAGYELMAELGRGGMGVVYKARHQRLNRLVALKMILAGTYAGPRDLARLRSEAEAVARLQHPNITQIYAIEEHDGQPFLALELVDGVGLHQHLGRERFSFARAAVLAETLARAVHYAHQRGVVHRDLKPSNVLIAADGTPKITDFGLAKLLDTQSGPTATEGLLGTPNYMAPEQARGRGKEVGPAADIYSLGAILYELLTGRPPFRGGTVLETLDQVRAQEPRAPHRLRRGLPRDLETICLKCLDKEPARRYRRAEDLANDLRRFLNHEPIAARPTPWWRRVGKWARRRPTAAVLVAAAVMLLVGVAAALVWSRLEEAARLDRLRAGVQATDRLGQMALARQDWPLAQAHFATALNQIDTEPALADLRDPVAELHAQAGRRLAEDAERRRLEGVYRDFIHARDDALFHGLALDMPQALATGMAPSSLRCAARTAARRALNLAGFDPDSTAPWQPDAGFAEAQRVEITAGCHAVLLVVADTTPHGNDDEQASGAIARLTERARKLPVSQAQQHFLTGHRQYRRGELAQAIRSFERTLAAQPDHFWAHCCLAVCAMRQQQWERARLRLDLCLLQRPDFVWARLLRGQAESRYGALEAAALDLQEAERLLARAANTEAQYVLLVSRADLAQRQDNLARAAADLREAVALQPEQYAAHLSLAAICARMNLSEATEHLTRALALKPPASILAEFHATRGRDLYRAKRYKDAVAACALALEQQADSTFALGVYGQTLLQLRRFAEAAKAFDRYLAAGGPVTVDAYRGRGQARMQLGEYLGAVDDYTRVVEQAPSAEIYTHRGWAYFFADAFKPALRDFDTALRLEPAGGNAYTGRALAHVMLGKVSLAVADAESALKHKPATPDMMQNLACVFALAAVKVEADTSAAERGKLAAAYRIRGMRLVEATLDLVPPPERAQLWRTQVLPDTALDSLRQLPEFKQLAQQYGGN
jgi:tetratricopeptide (TPR) repeat protein/tRNA A-37 threonylcarbamoyl transferase component Bud32